MAVKMGFQSKIEFQSGMLYRGYSILALVMNRGWLWTLGVVLAV